jgi:hypothetical protein
LSGFVEQISGLSRRRAKVIHGIWAVKDDKPESIFIIQNFFVPQKGPQEYEVNDFGS